MTLVTSQLTLPKYPKVQALESEPDYIIAIGDVHGCAKEENVLFSRINELYDSAKLTFIYLGDLIDRGPDSAKVVEKVSNTKNAYCCLGNHEEKHLRYQKHLLNGTSKVMKVDTAFLSVHDSLTDDNFKWMASLPHAITWKDWIFTHAGMAPSGFNTPLKAFLRTRYIEFKEDTKQWISSRTWQDENGIWKHKESANFWADLYNNLYKIIYGHEPYTDVKISKKNNNGGICFGIDTECYKTGKLTAMIIDCKDESYIFSNT